MKSVKIPVDDELILVTSKPTENGGLSVVGFSKYVSVRCTEPMFDRALEEFVQALLYVNDLIVSDKSIDHLKREIRERLL